MNLELFQTIIKLACQFVMKDLQETKVAFVEKIKDKIIVLQVKNLILILKSVLEEEMVVNVLPHAKVMQK